MIGYARLTDELRLGIFNSGEERAFPAGTLVEIYDGTRPGFKFGLRFRIVVLEDRRFGCALYNTALFAMLSPLESLAVLSAGDLPLEARGAGGS